MENRETAPSPIRSFQDLKVEQNLYKAMLIVEWKNEHEDS
jgi:hypothetical protein